MHNSQTDFNPRQQVLENFKEINRIINKSYVKNEDLGEVVDH